MKLPSKRRLLIYTGIFLVVALAAGELFLRRGAEVKLRTQVYPPIWRPSGSSGYGYIPGAQGLMCIPVLCRNVRINNQGYSGADFPLAKPAGHFRIAVVANSNGVQIWTEDGESFISLLGQQLRGRSQRVEVLNFSVDGHRRDLENIELIKSDVLRYAPDLVVLQSDLPLRSAGFSRKMYGRYYITYPADDPSKLAAMERDLDWIEGHRVLVALYQHSYLVRAGANAYYKILDPPVSGDQASGVHRRAHLARAFVEGRYQARTTDRVLSLDQSIAALRDLQGTLAAAGARFVLLGYTGSVSPAYGLTRRSGIDVITVRFPQSREERLGFVNQHLSRVGHESLARELLPKIVPYLPADARVSL